MGEAYTADAGGSAEVRYRIMPLICFKYKPDKVASGEKRQTIRLLRKRPIKVGDMLYLYEKCRTKQMRKLGEYDCKDVFTIEMQYVPEFLGDKPATRIDVYEEGRSRQMLDTEMSSLAIQDGFATVEGMMVWFVRQHGELMGKRKFQVIRW